MIKLTIQGDTLDAMRQAQLARKGLIGLLLAFEDAPDATQFVELAQVGMLFDVLNDIDEAAHRQCSRSVTNGVESPGDWQKTVINE